ncbi:MAG TPA: hypothetical protein VFT61_08130 [Sphingomicrobium sp.]|nr:hypothetical protein [Sphingomicrobium sp.]
MKILATAVALGASVLSTQALAQAQTPPGTTPSAPAQGQAPAGRGGWIPGPETRDQAKQRADMMFQRVDLNHDGTFTREEADQILDQMSSGDNSSRADRMEQMFNRLLGSAKSITQAQFEAQMLARFDAADLNHDGTVTPEERQQAMAALRAKAQGK